ncbi:hypothetical protein PR002_g17302 [Phytophthora rubi]|uniref:HAT C-terminal dimerisation domain-containing protein n=1 Tax=Phytophthora rubi TaxID=129364 RepID=A0A6A3K8R6_9STRA|nr:hypothetical protein PR002_g17302 [Phytophthora rubi]
MLALPGDTRWGSLLASMNSILEAEDVLFSVVSGRNFMEAKTKKKRQAHQLVFNLLFLDLPTSIETCGLPAREVKVVKGLVKERFDFIYRDAHGVGSLLDPRYRGLGMDSTTRGNVRTLLAHWHDRDDAANEVAIELVRFRRFASEMSIKSPRVRSRKGCTDAPSSSASERNFSTHGFMYSRLRNRLEPDRVEKLVHVYFNARNIQDDDMKMYSDLDDLLRQIDHDDEEENTRDNPDADFVYE